MSVSNELILVDSILFFERTNLFGVMDYCTTRMTSARYLVTTALLAFLAIGRAPLEGPKSLIKSGVRSRVGACKLQGSRSNVLLEREGMMSQVYRLLRPATGKGMLSFIFFFLILMTLPHSTFASPASKPELLLSRSALNRRASNESSLLECLQVSPPVLSPEKPTCQQTLMVHTFGLSYGKPFVGEYQPPNCTFNRVTFNFTVTSAGRQFDRLALMFFGDIEIFRTSTAEPTRGGIIWTYVKDMSSYLALFQAQQKTIFDLGNLVDDTYTGSWNTTLTATFFTAEDNIHPADVILPVSARKSIADGPSGFVVPETKAIDSLTLPQNARKAIFSISACGQATEEFWWSNVLSSDTGAFGNGTTLYGNSPFRELQLFIDGMLAGVAWPFPIIFTGGIIPGFWRPVVGIDAFDLREDEIDISPFIGLLSDGKLHSFEIRVVGIDDDGQGKGELTEAIGSNWVVTGKVFVWVDPDSEVTKGTLPTIDAPNPSLSLSSTRKKGANGTVQSLDYSVQVARSLVISSNISTSLGTQTMVWEQSLTFYNKGKLTNAGNDQVMRQKTTGSATSPGYSKTLEYPLGVTSSYNELPGGNFTIEGQMERGKYIRQLGDLAFPNEWKTFDYSRLPTQYKPTHVGATSNNWQNGTATYLGVPAQKRSYGSGSTEQLYSLSSIGEDAAATVQDSDSLEQGGNGAELYRRHVIAANDSIIYDEVSFGELTTFESRYNSPMTYDKVEGHGFAETGARQMLGRGPF